MRLVTLLLIVIGISLSNAIANRKQIEQNTHMIKAGIALTMTQKFYDAYVDDVMFFLKQNLTDLKLQNSSPQFNIGLVKAIFQLTNQSLNYIDVNNSQSSLQIADSKPYILYKIDGIDLGFSLSYNLYSKPEWIKDQGFGQINITNLSISMHMIPYNKKGKLQLNYSDIEVDIQTFNTSFSGVTDFSKAFNLLLGNFQQFFKVEVGNLVAKSVVQAFGGTFNHILSDFTGLFPIYKTISLNYSLTGDPIFNKDFLTFPYDGAVNLIDNPRDPEYELQEIPTYNDEEKEFQMFISQNSLSSAFKAWHKANQIKQIYEGIPQSELSLIFDNFDTAYGTGHNLTIELTTADPAPILNITESKNFIYSKVNIKIKNPLNEKLDAVKITSNLTAQIDLNVSSFFNITGKVESIEFGLENLTTYYKSSASLETVQIGLKLMESELKQRLDLLFAQGLMIPLPKVFSQGLEQPELITYDGFLMVQANPKGYNKTENNTDNNNNSTNSTDPENPENPSEPSDPTEDDPTTDPNVDPPADDNNNKNDDINDNNSTDSNSTEDKNQTEKKTGGERLYVLPIY